MSSSLRAAVRARTPASRVHCGPGCKHGAGRRMIVFVRYNLGPGVAVELQEESSVLELKEVVGSQQGVQPELLRVLFAGRELRSSASLKGCDLPEQSTVHVFLPPSGSSSSSQLLPLEEQEQEHDSLTRLDLSSSRLPASPSSSSLDGGDGGGATAELREEVQQEGGAGVKAAASSSFFVFCKSCNDLKPGKLRVRCRSCRQSSLRLSRGPSCWDDVLLRGHIHGVCQSDGCPGSEAEFYMKCGSHPTSDDNVSVALDLVMNNSREVSCLACTDTMPVVLVFQCAQRHVICLDCFRDYCQTRLNERQFVFDPVIGYSLPCPVGCADSLIKELHHFRILGNEQYGRYLQFGAEQCVLGAGGLLCPAPGCGAGLLPPPGGGRRVQCAPPLGCSLVFCRDCRESYHEGACGATQAPATPAAAQAFVRDEDSSVRASWDRASQLLLHQSTKPCPQCSVPVERNGGCMHMQCPMCGAEWCWLCGVIWNRECMGNHWFG